MFTVQPYHRGKRIKLQNCKPHL